jgi:hypothetical protein
VLLKDCDASGYDDRDCEDKDCEGNGYDDIDYDDTN